MTVIGWNQIGYGAALSAVVAGIVLAIAVRGRRPGIIATGALAAVVGPVAWNAILRAAHGQQFFTDAPVRLFPVSWQDTGSGVFALAAAVLAFGFGTLGREPARRTAAYGLLTGLAALVVDVYLY
jgi:hypothetical protein